MPPIRSITAATKPIKTERTHEENQERAYIAASRRSDRSLEARIESARRASEIHKRRTGRSLRVTEQDVVNEEMYEEEDDDLPMQYRRLTAHLNNNSSDFNRRLASYLTNHVAMRSALDQAISSSYAQQQNPDQRSSNAPIMQQPWVPSPGLAQFANRMIPPQMLQRPASGERQAPYPSPSTQSYRPQINHQGSSSSIHSNKPNTIPSLVPRAEDRRSSAPMVSRPSLSGSNHSPVVDLHRSASSSSLPEINGDNDTAMPPPSSTNPSTFSSPQQGWHGSQSLSMSPLSTTLPRETQMFLSAGPGTSHDPFGNSMLENSKMQQSFYQSHDQFYPNNSFEQPYLDGMRQTLAPGAFENQDQYSNWSTPTSGTADFAFTSPPNFNIGSDQDFGFDTFSDKVSDSLFSGQLTPADNDWAALIDTNSWDDNEM